MRFRALHILLALCLAGLPAAAQEYSQPPVTVSSQKIRLGGKVYLSHVVLEKQTLYSIARAYGVTVDDICNANPDMNLKEEGPKVNAIILIPYNPEGIAQAEETASQVQPAPEESYIIHTVKWYDDINSIAEKYGVSAERILEYNGLASPKLKRRMKLRIPTGAAATGDSTQQITPPETAPVDSSSLTPAVDSTEIFVFKKREVVNALLVLPFGADTSPSESSMEFYAGFLLGVKDLGKQGVSTDLSVYDISNGSLPITAGKISQSDLVIGPVSPSDVQKVLAIDSSDIPVVSPLDSRTLSLVSGNKALIHAPTPADVQYEEVVKWIGEDFREGDKVFVISEEGGGNEDLAAMVDTLLQNASIPHTMYSYGLLKGRRVADEIQKFATDGTMRVVIASDHEAFVTDAVRNLVLLLSYHKNNVILYSSSKLRTFTKIEVEGLHKLNLHAAVSYFIDYDSPKVRDFIMVYRALYNSEPTQFSFQGYDLATFFISKCWDGGYRWSSELSAIGAERGLQTDFLFSCQDEGGLVNTAIRRVLYTPDYKITLL